MEEGREGGREEHPTLGAVDGIKIITLYVYNATQVRAHYL